MDTSKHAKFDQVNEHNPKPSTRQLHKKRLPGQGQSIDDDTISYYNRYLKIQDLHDRRMIKYIIGRFYDKRLIIFLFFIVKSLKWSGEQMQFSMVEKEAPFYP